MSTVKKYLDLHLDRVVVHKTVDKEEDKARLHDEIIALMNLRSNHVVEIYDVVIEGNSLAGFLEEFIDGEELLDHQATSREEKIKIIWQIASGIKDIHSKNVLHRDIKPQNIKIDNEGIVKIFDFGLAKVNADSASTVGVKGTPIYAAPEQMKGGHVQLTTAVDVYSFAVVCSEICGVDPFHYHAKTGSLSGIFSVQDLITDKDLNDLLEASLEELPENRPTMNEIEDRLKKLILKGKHRAILTYEAGTKVVTKELSSSDKGLSLSVTDVGAIKIEYDDYEFIVKSCSGEVAINNMDAFSGMKIPGSCVISIGNAGRHYNNRAHITFDSSWPEVIV